MQLKGKKIEVKKEWKNEKDFGIYPKSIFRGKHLTAVDKLILIGMHSYPTNWILAHSRLANDLGCDKSNILTRWKYLIDRGFIFETADSYQVNYAMLSDSTDKVGLDNQGASKLAKEDPSQEGGFKPQKEEASDDMVGRVNTTNEGSSTPSNEYKDKKELENDKKEDNSNKDESDISPLINNFTTCYILNDKIALIRMYLKMKDDFDISIPFNEFERFIVYYIWRTESKGFESYDDLVEQSAEFFVKYKSFSRELFEKIYADYQLDEKSFQYILKIINPMNGNPSKGKDIEKPTTMIKVKDDYSDLPW